MGGKTSKELEALPPTVQKTLKKFDEDKKVQLARLELISNTNNDMIVDIVDSIRTSFLNCAPLSEQTLLMAWLINGAECEKILIEASLRVLNQPILHKEFDWYKKYVISSSVLLFLKANPTEQDKSANPPSMHVFNFVLEIAQNYQKKIIQSMNEIYDSLRHQIGWRDLLNIANNDDVMRQDHPKVGLLREVTLLRFKDSIAEMKAREESKSEEDKQYSQLEIFIDSHLVTNILIAAAAAINKEFQLYVKTILGEFGVFHAGPLKEMGRCANKVENDYFDEEFPKTAKLCDLVRCSCTFNTLSECMVGYNELANNIRQHPECIEIARIKNGFLSNDAKSRENGYRDVKLNVIFHSQRDKSLSMICEIQLILSQYLWEKKKIHKLYSIVRQKSAAGGAAGQLEVASGGGGCFDAESMVLLQNGTRKRAKDVRVGVDILQTYVLDESDMSLKRSVCGSAVKMVLSLERTEKSDRFYMVNFDGKLWVTPKHPIFETSQQAWVVPKKCFEKTNRNCITHTIDFVLETDHIINVNGLILITMAHKMFDRFPDLYHPIKATDLCLDYWKVRAPHTFPQCAMIVDDGNRCVEKKMCLDLVD